MAAFKGFRTGSQNWFETSGTSAADIWSAEGQRGGVPAKSVTAAGPQSAQAPVDGPVFALEPGPQSAAFAAGNFVVYRVGAIGSVTALNGNATAVFLDEYNAAGTRVQTIDMPTADNGLNQILTASGSATSEGLLTLSADGRYLILTGYDATLGTLNVATSSSATFARVIGRVDSSGNVDTTTTTTSFNAGNIRGAASTDGTTFWATGNNTGVVTTTLGGSGAGTLVSSTFTNLRGIDIYNGDLYVSASTTSLRLGNVGSGTPTTTGQTITNLTGFPTTGSANSPYQLFFADLTAAVAGKWRRPPEILPGEQQLGTERHRGRRPVDRAARPRRRSERVDRQLLRHDDADQRQPDFQPDRHRRLQCRIQLVHSRPRRHRRGQHRLPRHRFRAAASRHDDLDPGRAGHPCRR
jgi:hypothetical protein